MERRRPFYSVLAGSALVIALCSLAQAQYGGGSGTADDPYLIYTPEQMNAIGADPNDWAKHFKLMADIDLSQYTGTEFNLIGMPYLRRAGHSLLPFTGVFDGNGHIISNFNYTGAGEDYVGLFRCIDDPNAEVKDLGMIDPNVDGRGGSDVGALVGRIGNGTISRCDVVGGSVSGGYDVGGLAGATGYGNRAEENIIAVTGCHSTCVVVGTSNVGGLVGDNRRIIANSSATGVVTGQYYVGGLAGSGWMLTECYADSIVVGAPRIARSEGGNYVGGLAGVATFVTDCYAAALVRGASYVGGLLGSKPEDGSIHGQVVASFWDLETSGQATSAGGTGQTTAEMQQRVIFLPWGQGENASLWTIDDGNDYPRLAWENRPGLPIVSGGSSGWFAGSGAPDDPFLIYTADQMDLIGQLPDQWDKHYKLMADIDLATYGGNEFHLIGIPFEDPFQGVFDGNGHTISNFTYTSNEEVFVGLFRSVGATYFWNEEENRFERLPGTIKNLGLINPSVNTPSAYRVGALVGKFEGTTITNCYVDGGTIWGAGDFESFTGGLVGICSNSTIVACRSNAVVIGGDVGGLVGYCCMGAVENCYATGTVIGSGVVGGLVGPDYHGSFSNCYAAGTIVGLGISGGLVGYTDPGYIVDMVASFWDVETSGLATSVGGTGLTTAEMMTAAPFLEAGWDFVGEAENGTAEIWWIDEGRDYPRLWWERADGEF